MRTGGEKFSRFSGLMFGYEVILQAIDDPQANGPKCKNLPQKKCVEGQPSALKLSERVE